MKAQFTHDLGVARARLGPKSACATTGTLVVFATWALTSADPEDLDESWLSSAVSFPDIVIASRRAIELYLTTTAAPRGPRAPVPSHLRYTFAPSEANTYSSLVQRASGRRAGCVTCTKTCPDRFARTPSHTRTLAICLHYSRETTE